MTVRTGTVSGYPAKNMAMRHSLARWELGPSTLPMTTSPITCDTQAIVNDAQSNLTIRSRQNSVLQQQEEPEAVFVTMIIAA